MPCIARSRLWTPAACYHVLNRGRARQTVFHDNQPLAQFLHLLARDGDRFGTMCAAT